MTEQEYLTARANIDMADSMFGDLPDGAYWAACEEIGADMDLQMAVDDYERERGLGVHKKKAKTRTKVMIQSIEDNLCPQCKLKCKTLAGLSKHMNSKHNIGLTHAQN